jgi:hypothetical protein
MDQIQEEKDISNQISEAISRPAQDMFEDVSSIGALLFICWNNLFYRLYYPPFYLGRVIE